MAPTRADESSEPSAGKPLGPFGSLDRGVRRTLEAALLAVLVTVSVFSVRGHQRDDSPIMDETYHLFAGAEYLENGTFWTNLEHPPLVKLLAAAALHPLGAIPPGAGRTRDVSPHNSFLDWLYHNRARADALVAAGRRPFPFLLAALVVVVWAAARRLHGPGAGLLAASLVALDPSFVGHAGVIHTDVAASLTMTATVVLVLLAVERPSLARWLAAGAGLGLALASKFTAVLLVPLFLLSPLLGAPGPRARGQTRDAFLRAATGLLLSIAVLAGFYAYCLRAMPVERAAGRAAAFLAERGADGATAARLSSLSRISPALGHYAAGLAGVVLFSEHGRGANYLMGRVSEEGSPLYFPVAFLVKSTPAFLALVLALLVLGRRELLTPRSLAFLVPAAVVFLAAVRSSFNIGHRHILPVYPLLAVVGAGVLARRLSPRAFAAAAGLLAASAAFSLQASHPLEIAYFNRLSGGPERGARWLSDSNLDWGQDLKRLASELKRRGWESTTTVVAYSGLATDYFLPSSRVLEPGEPIRPGRYAVSSLIETVGPSFVETLSGEEGARQVADLLRQLRERGRRVGRAGWSITIWELPPAPGDARP
ncbi:MAG: phospholipid carrier-dependent glycosyltransferase [Acidobacteria bacterium]|nr:MAG: phospholipid carrier-dependent glycosyltransferase [Acidobacteriota bacterium]MCE7957708.1 phospholipid carrier-dependent glycosyltransferase [Acidobacteria bacterium ACB2]